MSASRFDRDSVKAIPVFVVVFLLLKAYVVARYSLTTAGALVSTAPVTVLVGTVTSYLNTVILLTFVGAAIWLFRRVRSSGHAGGMEDAGEHEHELEAMVFGVFLIAFLFLPVPASISYFAWPFFRLLGYLLLVAALVYFAWRVIGFLAPRAGFGFLRPILGRRSWFVALFVVVVLMPSLRRPWVPSEVLVLRDDIAIRDSHLVNGRLETSRYPIVYVLSTDEQWTTTLDTETRILLRLPTSSVQHRQVCRYRGQPPATVPLAAFLFGYRYHSPNTMCDTLVENHEDLLDPLIPSTERAN